ncbi:MAG: histidine kinase dimerization/phospho-acceptor domain-containing protein, partial [Desulfovibrionaceae bacterium]|nr:histidine kinase dimerization/phospho-acceptor domain-containing protein [Desulfovibrionaceae bacterium]
MNAIIGLSFLLLKTGLTTQQHDQLEKIHGAAHSLLGIINDILDFSKIESGKITIEEVPFQLDETLESVRSLFAQAAQD